MKNYPFSIRPNGMFHYDYDFFENFQKEIYNEYGYTLDKLCPTSDFWYYDKLNDTIQYYNKYVHNYYIEYAEHFHKKRNTALKVLEVGVYTGFSMLLWERYFPNAEIYGIDINIEGIYYDNKNPYQLCKDKERINLFEFDGTDKEKLDEFIKKVGGDFDIIIDDASHLGDHQIKTLIHLLPHLKKDGIFVVEDIGLYPTGTNSFWIEHNIHNYLEVGITDPNDKYSNEWNGIPMFEYFMKNYNNIPKERLEKYTHYLSKETKSLLDKVKCEWVNPIDFETTNYNINLNGHAENFITKGNSKMCFIKYKQ